MVLLGRTAGASIALVLCICAAMASALPPPDHVPAASNCIYDRMRAGWNTTRAPHKSVFTAIKEEMKGKGIKLCGKPVVELWSACTRKANGTSAVDYQIVAHVACKNKLDFMVQSAVRFSIRAGKYIAKVDTQTELPYTDPGLLGSTGCSKCGGACNDGTALTKKCCGCPPLVSGNMTLPQQCQKKKAHMNTKNASVCVPQCPSGTTYMGGMPNYVDGGNLAGVCCPPSSDGGTAYTCTCVASVCQECEETHNLGQSQMYYSVSSCTSQYCTCNY